MSIKKHLVRVSHFSLFIKNITTLIIICTQPCVVICAGNKTNLAYTFNAILITSNINNRTIILHCQKYKGKTRGKSSQNLLK